jgi:hypothetical protein
MPATGKQIKSADGLRYKYKCVKCLEDSEK